MAFFVRRSSAFKFACLEFHETRISARKIRHWPRVDRLGCFIDLVLERLKAGIEGVKTV